MNIIMRNIIVIAIVLASTACASTRQKQSSLPVVEISVDASDIDLYYQMVDKAKEQGVAIDAQFYYENYFQLSSEAFHDFADVQYKGYLDYTDESGEEQRAYQDFLFFEYRDQIQYLEDNRELFLSYKNILTQDMLDVIAQSLQESLDFDLSSTIYLTIGWGKMFGTAYEKGIILDISMLTSPDLDYSNYAYKEEVDSSVLPKNKDLVFIAIHEVMHQLQQIAEKKSGEIYSDSSTTIGDFILVEGGANFFALLLLDEQHVMGEIFDQQQYFESHPQEMVELLNAKDVVSSGEDSNQKLLKQWFFNRDQVAEGVPPDMGYYLGAVICTDFYERAKDKKEAFKKIILYRKYRDEILDSYIRYNM